MQDSFWSIFASKCSMQHLRQVSSHPKKMGNLMIPVKPHQSCPFSFTAHSQTSVKWPPNDPKSSQIGHPARQVLPTYLKYPQKKWISFNDPCFNWKDPFSVSIHQFSAWWPKFPPMILALLAPLRCSSHLCCQVSKDRRTTHLRKTWMVNFLGVFELTKRNQDALCLNDGGQGVFCIYLNLYSAYYKCVHTIMCKYVHVTGHCQLMCL